MFFVIFGVWSDKRDMKEPFMFAFAIVILGDLLYAFADTTCVNDWTEDAVCEEAPGLIKSAGLYLMLAGRLICGIGGANTTLTQAYFARAASPSQRTKMLALANGCQMIGIMLGPAMSIMFVHIDIGIGDFRLYQNTSPGYVMVRTQRLYFRVTVRTDSAPPHNTNSTRAIAIHAPLSRPSLTPLSHTPLSRPSLTPLLPCPSLVSNNYNLTQALVNLFSLVAFYLWFENPPKDKVKVKYDKEFYGKVHKVRVLRQGPQGKSSTARSTR
jgi:MFS family permease